MPQQQTPYVQDIAYAALPVKNLERSVKFYSQTLELTVLEIDKAKGRASFSLPNGDLLQLISGNKDFKQPIIGFSVTNLNAATTQALDSGATISKQLKTRYVNRQDFKDLDGYLYAFVETNISALPTTANKDIKIDRIRWSGKEVADRESSRDFWNKVLGILHAEKSPESWGIPQQEYEKLPLTPWILPKGSEFEITDHGFLSAGKGLKTAIIGFGLTPENFDTALKLLRTRGVNMPTETINYYNLSWQYIQDPDGNLIEIYTVR